VHRSRLADSTEEVSSMRVLLAALLLLLILTAPAFGRGAGVPPPALRLALPGQAWTLEIPADDLAIDGDVTRPDGRSRALAAQDSAGLIMTVFLEAEQAATSQACREKYWERLKSRSPLTMDDVKMTERGSVALLEYVVREYQQMRLDQKHLNAYLAKNGACVDIHLSKVQFTAADEARMIAMATGARIRDTGPAASPGPTARAYLVPKGGALRLIAPDTWRVSLPQTANGLPTITFLPPAGNDPQVLITAFPPKAGTAPQRPELRREAEASGKRALAHAVERAIALRELRGPQAFGYFYTLTDRAPGSKGYKYMTQAHLAVGGLAVKATILFNKPQVAAQQTVFEMLRSASHRPLRFQR
jgi:hypothetical protein